MFGFGSVAVVVVVVAEKVDQRRRIANRIANQRYHHHRGVTDHNVDVGFGFSAVLNLESSAPAVVVVVIIRKTKKTLAPPEEEMPWVVKRFKML